MARPSQKAQKHAKMTQMTFKHFQFKAFPIITNIDILVGYNSSKVSSSKTMIFRNSSKIYQ